jgi:hypothetical protein
MLADTQQLLTLFGIPATIREGEEDPRGYAKRYTLAILGDRSKEIFQARIGFLSERKQEAVYRLLARQKSKSAAEMLTLPFDFTWQAIKPVLYEAHRQANGRVPTALHVFASKLNRGHQRISLPRAEWLRSSLLATEKHTLAPFLEEAVQAQYFEVKVTAISHEAAVPMYDIGVEEVEQYLANGIVVHNSVNPNLQNIPIRTELGRRIRRAFVPADGCVLLSADYSQIELRLLAHITEDAEMLDAFRNGEDIHARTARKVFGAQTDAELKEKRRVAKIVNFAIAYAVGAFGLAPRVGLTRTEAKKVIEDYYATFKGVRRYMEETPDKVREANGVVRSLLGRWRKLPDISNKNHNLRARAEREAINLPMQGSASDIVKLAMLRTDEALRRANLHTQMILQVHDELVFEVPAGEIEQASATIKHAMEAAFQLSVPLLVEIGWGANWMAAKP